MKKGKKEKKKVCQGMGPNKMRKQEVKARALSRRCRAFQVEKVVGRAWPLPPGSGSAGALYR